MGECMYFVELGTACATIDGEDVFEYSAGDFFGELALLRSKPCAATVRQTAAPSAVSPCPSDVGTSF